MSRIRFISDSGSDLPPEYIKEAEIDIIPFSIECLGKSYREGKDISFFDMYRILETESVVPTHSQINSYEILARYNAALSEGYSQIVVVFISSTSSSTHSNAIIAKEMFFEEHPCEVGKVDIHVIDSKSYSLGYGYAVYQAAMFNKKGIGINTILAYLEDWFSKVEVYLGLYSLYYAKKSGRIGTLANIIGESIGIRPVLSLIDGEIKQIAIVRGEKALIPKIVSICSAVRSVGTPYSVIGGSDQNCTDEFEEKLKEACGEEYVGRYQLGAVVTINTGPRSIAAFVLNTARSK